MYAVIKNKIVQSYSWESKENDNYEYVLMTFDNSPAWINGLYIDGKFYPPEEE